MSCVWVGWVHNGPTQSSPLSPSHGVSWAATAAAAASTRAWAARMWASASANASSMTRVSGENRNWMWMKKRKQRLQNSLSLRFVVRWMKEKNDPTPCVCPLFLHLPVAGGRGVGCGGAAHPRAHPSSRFCVRVCAAVSPPLITVKQSNNVWVWTAAPNTKSMCVKNKARNHRSSRLHDSRQLCCRPCGRPRALQRALGALAPPPTRQPVFIHVQGARVAVAVGV